MDAYDDCGSWFPEQNSPINRRLDAAQQQQHHHQFFDHHQQQNQFSTSFHLQQQQQQQQQPQHQRQRSQCASNVGSASSSGLNSPSSGYCSADDSSLPVGAVGLVGTREKTGPISFAGSASPFSAAAAAAGGGITRLYPSPPIYGGGELSTYSSSTTTNTCFERQQSPSGDSNTTAANWRADTSPGRVITASADPCLGQQPFATPRHQRFNGQQQQQRSAAVTSVSSTSSFCPSTVKHEFFDDHISTWSGGIGMDEFEAFWDPFGGGSATSACGIERLAGSDYWNFEANASTSALERMDVMIGAVSTSSSATSPSFRTTTHNQFRQCHSTNKPAASCSTYSTSTAATDYLAAGFSSQNTSVGAVDCFGGRSAAGGRDDGASIEFGFGLSTSALGEASLSDVVRSSCNYAGQSSSATGNDASITSTALFQVGSPSPGGFASPIASGGQVLRETYTATAAGTQLQHGYRSSPALVGSCCDADGSGSVAGYHLQHMAADMATGCDASDFELLPPYQSHVVSGVSAQSSALTHHRTSSMDELQTHQQQQQLSGGILGGMFSQRNPLRSCSETGKAAFAAASSMSGQASARSRGVAVAKSCGSLLQLAPPYGPGNGSTASVSQVRSAGGGGSGRNRTGSCNSLVPRSGCSRGDVRGGKSPYSTASAGCYSSLYPGLDDHRYTTRSMPYAVIGNGSSAPPPSKVQKTGRGGSISRSSAGGTGRAAATSILNSGSILEAFLRSTRPMDPNKGSNAALAAEGLFNLHIGDSSPRKHRSRASSAATSDNDDAEDGNNNDDDGEDDDETSGTLLKKLLTSNIDRLDGRRISGNRSPGYRRTGTGSRNTMESKVKLRKLTIEEEHQPSPLAPQNQASSLELAASGSSSPMMTSLMMQPPGNDTIIDSDTKTLIANGFGLSVLSGSGSPSSGNGMLGVDLDLSLLDDTNGIGLFGLIDEDVDDNMWSSAAPAPTSCFDFDDKLLLQSNEFDDILREENRHGQLWLQQYFVDDVIDDSCTMQATNVRGQAATAVGNAV